MVTTKISDWSWAWGALFVAFVTLFGCITSAAIRGLCTRRDQQTQESTTDLEQGLPEEEGFKTFTIDSSLKGVQCSICLESFGSLEVTTGICRHTYHAKCLSAWFAKDPTRSCPMCRTAFMQEDKLTSRARADI